MTDTKYCNCFITLNEKESETKSIRDLIKQYQILRMSGDSMIANTIVWIKSLCNKSYYQINVICQFMSHDEL